MRRARTAMCERLKGERKLSEDLAGRYILVRSLRVRARHPAPESIGVYDLSAKYECTCASDRCIPTSVVST